MFINLFIYLVQSLGWYHVWEFLWLDKFFTTEGVEFTDFTPPLDSFFICFVVVYFICFYLSISFDSSFCSFLPSFWFVVYSFGPSSEYCLFVLSACASASIAIAIVTQPYVQCLFYLSILSIIITLPAAVYLIGPGITNPHWQYERSSKFISSSECNRE